MQKRIDYYREYDRRRAYDPKRVDGRERYQSSEEGKAALLRSRHRWRAKNSEKRQAEIVLCNAVRDGRLEKPDACESCNQGGRIHGHHYDYSKPLDVHWLCPSCHAFVHKVERHANRLFERGEYMYF
jgi:hypothetical protein